MWAGPLEVAKNCKTVIVYKRLIWCQEYSNMCPEQMQYCQDAFGEEWYSKTKSQALKHVKPDKNTLEVLIEEERKKERKKDKQQSRPH